MSGLVYLGGVEVEYYVYGCGTPGRRLLALLSDWPSFCRLVDAAGWWVVETHIK